MKHYLMELLGTFFLTLAVCLASQPLGIGFMLLAMIYIAEPISGSHFNPAISLLMVLRNKLPKALLPGYIGAQCLGSFLAAALFYEFTESTFVLFPGQHISLIHATLIETLLTFVFATVILTVIRRESSHKGLIGGITIGLTLTGLIFIGGDLSGSIMNPAVALGTILLDTIKSGDSLCTLPMYLVGSLSGALLAWLFDKKMAI